MSEAASTFIVNGQEFKVGRIDRLTFEQVCALVNAPADATVTYHGGETASGSLTPGEDIPLTAGMVFNAYQTGNA